MNDGVVVLHDDVNARQSRANYWQNPKEKK
jgi:hypothetical protein